MRPSREIRRYERLPTSARSGLGVPDGSLGRGFEASSYTRPVVGLQPERRSPHPKAARRLLTCLPRWARTFGPAPQPGQFIAQLAGIATLLGLVLPLLYALFWLVNRVVPFRVDPDGERLGMDLHELGGGAYPEFVIHRDDSYR